MARSRFAIAFTLIGTVLSSAAHALGLGAAEATSGLNQPLEARIPLVAVQAGELDSLVVTLAPAQAYERAGIARPFALSSLRFQVVKGDKPFIRVSSTQPIKEPFLNFLVEASWSRGKLVREFTLLLDPPVYAPVQRGAAVSPAQSSGTATTRPARGAATATPAGASAAPRVAAGASEYGPVKSNDTLWKVAQRVRPGSAVSMNQTMVALLEANPDAFIDGDMNRLKRGQVLRVPDQESIAAIQSARANQVVRDQMARWRQSTASASQQTASPEPQGRLKVVAPSVGGEQAGASLLDQDLKPTPEAVEQLQDELKLSEESNASLQAENEELKQQVDALKQQPGEQAAVQIPVEQTVGESSEASADQAPVSDTGVEQSATEAQPEESAQAEEAAETQPAAEAQPPVAVDPAPEQPAEPSFLDDPKNLGMIAGGGLILALLAFLGLRRRKPKDEMAPVVAPVVAVPVVAEADEDEDADEDIQVAPAAAEAADEDLSADSDALGEVDVYLAYGRYDQAQLVISRALEQEPERTDLRLKLLEILALTSKREEFEAEARDLRDQVGDQDPAWQRAREMGREFLPDSLLFADDELISEADGDAALDLGDLSFEADEAETGEAAEQVPDLGEALDFDQAEPADAVADDEPAALDFDLDALKQEADEFSPEDTSVEFTAPVLEPSDEMPDGLDEVSTKLDLARAYLDMGDTEGARSLLDEVLAEGNDRQQGEAQALLKQIA